MTATAPSTSRSAGIGKSFGGTRALDDVSIADPAGLGPRARRRERRRQVDAGQDRGRGLPAGQGELVLRGETVSFARRARRSQRGIALVAQELALVPQLTVAENVFLGAEPRRAGFIDRRALRERFEPWSPTPASSSRPTPIVGSPAARRAAAGRDPAGAGPRRRADRARRADGAPVGDRGRAAARDRPRPAGRAAARSCSSRTSWARCSRSADTVTVLRDGRVVRTGPPPTRPRTASSPAMLGRPVGRRIRPSGRRRRTRPWLCRRRPPAPGVDGVSLDVRAARSWPRGARRRRPLRAGAGDLRGDPATAGEVVVGGRRARRDARRRRSRAGVAMIPESRKDEGLMLRRPVRENVSLASLPALGRFGFVRRGAERRAGARRARTGRRAPLLEAPAGDAVGRQPAEAAVRARAARRPGGAHRRRADAGVDVGAKRDIYELLVGSPPTGWRSCSSRARSRRSWGSPTGSLVMRGGRIVAELRATA